MKTTFFAIVGLGALLAGAAYVLLLPVVPSDPKEGRFIAACQEAYATRNAIDEEATQDLLKGRIPLPVYERRMKTASDALWRSINQIKADYRGGKL